MGRPFASGCLRRSWWLCRPCQESEGVGRRWLALAQKHNGVWGGCYCSYFHNDTEHTIKDEHDRPTFKQRLVAEGVAHAALVFDGDDAIAWCEYGSPIELPNIYHRKQYDAGETKPAPWRITCFFVDRDHRRSGAAREALDGALELIAQAGGGEVVSFPNELAPGNGPTGPRLTRGSHGPIGVMSGSPRRWSVAERSTNGQARADRDVRDGAAESPVGPHRARPPSERREAGARFRSSRGEGSRYWRGFNKVQNLTFVSSLFGHNVHYRLLCG
ncbi:hypothetical protein GCM10009747_12410 [Agromyces humatus]|uniref:GNAT family N-acetyltransferase n=1 Tax=Agromyces humatus TaxID=279573 RepID=A0ABN2KGR7_9MICO